MLEGCRRAREVVRERDGLLGQRWASLAMPDDLRKTPTDQSELTTKQAA